MSNIITFKFNIYGSFYTTNLISFTTVILCCCFYNDFTSFTVIQKSLLENHNQKLGANTHVLKETKIAQDIKTCTDTWTTKDT